MSYICTLDSNGVKQAALLSEELSHLTDVISKLKLNVRNRRNPGSAIQS